MLSGRSEARGASDTRPPGRTSANLDYIGLDVFKSVNITSIIEKIGRGTTAGRMWALENVRCPYRGLA
jgi:hypothetical protein